MTPPRDLGFFPKNCWSLHNGEVAHTGNFLYRVRILRNAVSWPQEGNQSSISETSWRSVSSNNTPKSCAPGKGITFITTGDSSQVFKQRGKQGGGWTLKRTPNAEGLSKAVNTYGQEHIFSPEQLWAHWIQPHPAPSELPGHPSWTPIIRHRSQRVVSLSYTSIFITEVFFIKPLEKWRGSGWGDSLKKNREL